MGFSYTDIRLRLVINKLHEDRIREIEEYWSQTAGIPLSQFQKPTVIKTPLKKVFDKRSSYRGVLRIRVSKSLSILRESLGGFEGLYESMIA